MDPVLKPFPVKLIRLEILLRKSYDILSNFLLDKPEKIWGNLKNFQNLGSCIRKVTKYPRSVENCVPGD